jgi:GTP-binding protein
LGTLVKDESAGRIICDCTEDGKRYVVARGGRGGKGNAELVTRSNPHPERSQPGGQGENRRLLLSLKVLADIGLVGRPNAGKSTFLSRVSKAQPKVAEYPFTTTEPYLGIVSFPGSLTSVVMADIPGLVENSHKGKGLGIRFLKHIERTRVLAVLVEVTSDDPRGDAETLLQELKAYSPVLAERPMCFVLTKADLCEAEPNVPEGWLAMSAVTGEGVERVLNELHRLWEALPPAEQ